jgi:hypothetical protein
VLEWIESFGYQFEPHKYQTKDWRDKVSPDWDGTVSRMPQVPLQAEDESRSIRYSNIAEVYTFKGLKFIDGEYVELQVQVIETSNNPIDTIMRYHSSASNLIIPFLYMRFNPHGSSLRHEYHYL